MTGFYDLNALLVNTSLKKDTSASYTRLLLNASARIMKENGFSVDHLHLVAADIGRS